MTRFGHGVANERAGLVIRQRLEPQQGRPARAAIEQLRPRHAQKQQRRARREQRGRLDELQECLLPPLNVVEDGDQRGLLLKQLADGPGDFLSRCWSGFRLTEERGDGRGCYRVGRKRLELLDQLDHRPIGDALAVREATPLDDPALNGIKRFGNKARLPNAGFADDSEEHASLVGERPLPGASDCGEFLVAADEARLRVSRARIVHVLESKGLDGLGLPLQRERFERLDIDRFTHELERRLPDQHFARAGGLFESGRDVDGVAGREPLLGPCDDLTRR
jgi:hypothetical protein